MNRNGFRLLLFLMRQHFPLDAEKVTELIEAEISGTEKLRSEKFGEKTTDATEANSEGMKRRKKRDLLPELWMIKLIYAHLWP